MAHSLYKKPFGTFCAAADEEPGKISFSIVLQRTFGVLVRLVGARAGNQLLKGRNLNGLLRAGV
jgi:hypothetical protein